MTDRNNSARKNFNLTKTLVITAGLGTLAVLVILFYLFPFYMGMGCAVLGFVGYLILNSVPPVKKTDSHTITVKKG